MDSSSGPRAAGGSGGSREFAGRKTNPVRSRFETVATQENLGKAPRDQQVRCKVCLERVSARPERMEKHLEKCRVSRDRSPVSKLDI